MLLSTMDMRKLGVKEIKQLVQGHRGVSDRSRSQTLDWSSPVLGISQMLNKNLLSKCGMYEP